MRHLLYAPLSHTSAGRTSTRRVYQRVAVKLSVIFSCLLLAAGCSTSLKDRSVLLKGVQLTDVVLHCTRTDIADIALKVPVGFDVVELRETQNDKFLIGRSSDTGIVTGQIIITVAPGPTRVIGDTAKYEKSAAAMLGVNVGWREYTFIEEGVELGSYGPPIYQREALSIDPLERFNKQRGAPLSMHVIVAGRDSLTVERLMASVQTMRFLPSKGNL